MNKKLTIGTTIIGVIICKLVFDKFKEVIVRDILANMAKTQTCSYRKNIDEVIFDMSGSRTYRDKPDDIMFIARGEAEEVLNELNELINSEYGVASVADLNTLVGSVGSFVDNKYGWKDLKDATIKYTHGGYSLALPKTILLD